MKRGLGRVVAVLVMLAFVVVADAPRAVAYEALPGVKLVAEGDPNSELWAVACPATTQCTAADGAARVITFNPHAVGSPAPVRLPVSDLILRLACPSTTQCTGVTMVSGEEVTFNPQSPLPTISVRSIASETLEDVSCPSLTQCTATGYRSGKEITFNPQSGATINENVIIGTGNLLGNISCPSLTQCTTVAVPSGSEGNGPGTTIVTFDPLSPAHSSHVGVQRMRASAVACPSVDLCTVIDGNPGSEAAFNPTVSGKPGLVHLGVGASDVACPTTEQCTAVGLGTETTFTPGVPNTATKSAFMPGPFLSVQSRAVSCPTTTQCTAVGSHDEEVTFNPGPPLPAPPSKCLVPRVGKNETLSQIEAAMRRNHCTVGRVRRVRDHRHRRGSVIAVSPRPLSRLPAGAPVSVTLSRG